ncbi:MAG: TetR family transcriptional regulator [Dehalococcoidales bacterium]|nr:TetR family transcriptional regulator [Dehalococcoidales bacterium]
MVDSQGGNKPLRVSDLERLTGVSRSRINTYVKNGVLSEPERSGKTMAYYSTVHLDELEELKRLRSEGYPLSYIRDILEDKRRNDKDVEVGEGYQKDQKENIIENATALFVKNGYFKTSMADIARTVGVSKSTVYLVFPNKQSLFLECADDVIKEMLSDIRRYTNKYDSPVDKLARMAEYILTSYPHALEMLSVMDNIIGENNNMEEFEKCREIYTEMTSIIIELLKEAQEEGIWPQVDLGLSAYLFVGIGRGLGSFMRLTGQYDTEPMMKALFSGTAFFGFVSGRKEI